MNSNRLSKSDRTPLWRKRLFIGAVVVGVVGASFAIGQLSESGPLNGITFASSPGTLYVPAHDLGRALEDDVRNEPSSKSVAIGNKEFRVGKRLFDGTGLVRVADAKKLGAWVDWDQETHSATVHIGKSAVKVHSGSKAAGAAEGANAGEVTMV